jgi:hypothetical protein
MALMYPWATKEYLLWNMTFGQIVLYHNLGVEMNNPKPDEPNGPTLEGKSAEEIKAIRDQLRQQYGEIE